MSASCGRPSVHACRLYFRRWPGPAAVAASGRAAIATELASLKVGDNRGITPATGEGQMAHPSGVSIEEAAEAMNVSPRSVKREGGYAREPRGRETRREEGGLMRARPQGLGRGAAGAAPLGGRGRMATQPLPNRPAARRSLARAMGAGGAPRAILAAHSVQRSRNTLDTATSSATYHPAGTRCTGLWSGMTVLQ